jgi:acetyl esterase/lipase
MITDIKAAVQFLVDNKLKYNFSDTLLVSGASAGGHLAMLYTYAHNTNGYVRSVGNIFGPSIISDWDWYNSVNIFLGKSIATVLTNNTGSAWDLNLYKSLSPYEIVNSDSKPTIIFHGTIDVIVPLCQSQWMASKLNSIGVKNQYVEYPLEVHGFSVGTCSDCVKKMVAFFKANVK